jgi:hypothetical protein
MEVARRTAAVLTVVLLAAPAAWAVPVKTNWNGVVGFWSVDANWDNNALALAFTPHGREFCLSSARWLGSTVRRLRPRRRPVITRTGAITTGSCSVCGGSPVTVVKTDNGEQIDVCHDCLDRNLKKGRWREAK